MKKIIFIDECDFSKTEQEFDDFHYKLTESLQDFISQNFKEKLQPTQIISSKDGKTLKFAINNGEDRLERESGDKLYIIKIEKYYGRK